MTDEEREIIEEKIPFLLNRADEIIKKVPDYHTVPDDEFMPAAKSKMIRGE